MQFVRTQHGSVIETANPDYWPDATPISRKEGQRQLLEESRAALLDILTPRGTKRRKVYTLVTHVAASGMSRSIRCFVIPGADQQSPDADRSPWDITHHVARLIGAKVDAKHGGLRVSGCGMDMGFHVVNSLGYALFPNGTPEPHSERNGESDRDGGYAILQSWL